MEAQYTLRYLLAMGLIAASFLLGAFQINKILEVNQSKGEIISIAAAQRTLAQQLLLLPDRIQAETNVYLKSRYIDQLRSSLATLQAQHAFLQAGREGMAPPAEASDALRQLYQPAGGQLNRSLDRFLQAFHSYVENPLENHQAIALQRVSAEDFLFVSLDRAVELHTQASDVMMAEAIKVHAFWVIASLVLMLLVILLVFRPMARDAARSVADIRAELDERASLLSRSFQIANMGHWRASNAQADPLWLSQELLDMYGMDLEEGVHPLSVLQDGDVVDDDTPLEANTQHLAFRKTWETGEPTVARSQFRKPDGNVIDMLVHMEAERDDTGAIVGVVGVIKDDTSEAEADRALKKSYQVIENKTRDLVEAQRLGKLATWRTTLDSDMIEWDERTFELLGYDPETFVPSVENTRRLCVDGSRERLIALAERVVETGQSDSETLKVQRGDGTLIDLYIRSTLERDAHGNAVALFGTIQDVTKERTAARELEQLAYFDNLTGLANRTLFGRELDRVCHASRENGHQAALLLLDLDHFKEVNDTLGHQAGDQLLGIIGRRLANITRTGNFVARLGGDEFAIIVEDDVSTDALDAVCQRIIEAVGVPASLSHGNVRTNASIGIAMVPKHSAEPSELLRFADLALYASKEAGRGRATFYSEAYSAALSERLSMAGEIRSALDEKRFEMHYQPVVDIKSGKVSGFEALMRLPKPGGGYVPPDQFIPVSESSHLIADLGEFALNTACHEAKEWLDAGLPERTVAVNVSAAQMWHGDLELVIDRALQTSGLDPRLLCIELTESVFAAENLDRLEGILRRLKARGVSLALDDFGTGYSSLGYLNQLPFDKLKIDRTFVSGADMSAEKQKLLRGILSLGNGLDLSVVAEGVETNAELELVRSLGCDSVQGWLFARAQKGEQAVIEAARIEANIALSAQRLQARDSRNGDAVVDALLRSKG